MTSRDEELKALAAAKTAIKEKAGGAAEQDYGLSQVSLFQPKKADRDSYAMRFIRELSMKQNFQELAQLASRMASAAKGAGT